MCVRVPFQIIIIMTMMVLVIHIRGYVCPSMNNQHRLFRGKTSDVTNLQNNCSFCVLQSLELCSSYRVSVQFPLTVIKKC